MMMNMTLNLHTVPQSIIHTHDNRVNRVKCRRTHPQLLGFFVRISKNHVDFQWPAGDGIGPHT